MTAGRTPGVGPTTPAEEARDRRRRREVAEAAAAALDGLAALERHAREVADAFRWRHVGPARAGLSGLVDSLQTLLKLGVIAAQVCGTDLVSLCRATGEPADERTRRAADRIIDAQMACDWPALASAIDGDLVAALDAWREVFELLGADAGDFGPGGRAA